MIYKKERKKKKWLVAAFIQKWKKLRICLKSHHLCTGSSTILDCYCINEFPFILIVTLLFIHQNFENYDDIRNILSIYFAQKPTDLYQSSVQNLLTREQKVVGNKGDCIIK